VGFRAGARAAGNYAPWKFFMEASNVVPHVLALALTGYPRSNDSLLA